MFLLESTPDTTGYLIAGYAVAFIVMALYLVSLYIRTRNLNQDLNTLEEMEQLAKAQTSKPAEAPKSVTKRARK
jgi:cell division protein FtsL